MSSDSEAACPRCNTLNTDNWPLWVDGEITSGGCQECWERQCSREWWEMIMKLEAEHEQEMERQQSDTGIKVWACMLGGLNFHTVLAVSDTCAEFAWLNAERLCGMGLKELKGMGYEVVECELRRVK